MTRRRLTASQRHERAKRERLRVKERRHAIRRRRQAETIREARETSTIRIVTYDTTTEDTTNPPSYAREFPLLKHGLVSLTSEELQEQRSATRMPHVLPTEKLDDKNRTVALPHKYHSRAVGDICLPKIRSIDILSRHLSTSSNERKKRPPLAYPSRRLPEQKNLAPQQSAIRTQRCRARQRETRRHALKEEAILSFGRIRILS